MMEPGEVRQAEQERRNLCGAFLIRCKGHLDRLARAGLDTRIVRELVVLHTLATMGLDRMDQAPVYGDDVMEEINVQSFFDPLDRPVSAGEAALVAERSDAGDDYARLVTVAREVCAYERPLEALADVLADMGEDATPQD